MCVCIHVRGANLGGPDATSALALACALTPWAWSESKSNELIMEILTEDGGGPLPVWCLQVEPCQQEPSQLWVESPWSSSFLKASSMCPGEVMSLSCTNLAGETVCRHVFPKSAHVAEALVPSRKAEVSQQLSSSQTITSSA